MTIDQHSVSKLNFIYPPLKPLWCRVAQDMWNTHKRQIMVIEGLRTFEKQAEYYARGRKQKPDGSWEIVDKKQIITYAPPGASIHHYGLALDSGFLGDPYLAKSSAKERDFLFAELGRFYQAHNFVWGADWNGNGRSDDEKFVDRPHAQLTYGLTLKDIRQLYAHGGNVAVWAKCDQIRGLPIGQEWGSLASRTQILNLGQMPDVPLSFLT